MRTPEKRNSGTFLALLALVAMAIGLMSLMAVVLQGPFLAVVIIAGVFFFFGAFHYLAWGWWMPARPRDDEE